MSREMKHSGIDWIGEIPKEWKLVPTKRLFSCKKQIAGENAVDYERLALTMQGVIKRDKEDNEGLQPEKFDGYQILKRNEIVFKLIDLANIKTSRVGLSPYLGIVSPAYIIIRNNSEDNRYFYYWFMFMYHQNIFNQMGDDGVRSSLNADDVLKIPIANISLSEQQKIANYLDKVCGEMDEMIALQEQMIEDLKAYKQSVITEAVTKGLNRNVPMKESGIDWIGEVPEGWRISKIKMIAKTNSGSTPRNISNSDNSDIIWIRTTDINDDVVNDSSIHLTLEEFSSASCPMLDRGACVVAMYGGSGTIGKSGFLDVRATINQALCSMEVNDSYHDKYLFCVLKAVRYYWMKYAVGTRKDPNISQETVRNMFVPMPSLSEQQSIATYLDTKCAEIDDLIAIKASKIEELKDYKKSVIYEYVTGKKEVV